MRKNDQLKVIGLAVMVLDHFALFVFGTVPWLYIVARFIGFPFFAYGVAMGALHTSNPKKYLGRLLIFGVLSQPLFYLATDQFRLNVCFTLLIGAASVMLWKNGNRWGKAAALLLPILGGTWEAPFVGYGAYGIGMILSFGMGPFASAFYQIAASWWFLGFNDVQALAVFSLLFIYVLPVPSVRLPRWVYYASYPGHLAAIAAIKIFS